MTIREPIVVAGACLFALAVRCVGLLWSSPGFYEEATPLHVAWGMWSFGEDRFTGHPEFFRYPSLVFYVQLLGQALLYGWLSLTGAIESSLDFQSLYAVEPVAFFAVARFVTALFGAATVGLCYLLARQIGLSVSTSVLASLLLALNPLHLASSQRVEVDVPLTFLATWALYECARFVRVPSRKAASRLGIAIGLATSAKYPGAMLAASALTAWWLASSGRSTRLLLPMTLGAVLSFALTSPWIVLDLGRALGEISQESFHMRYGHFGLDEGSAFTRYLKWALSSAFGIVATLATVFGVLHSLRRKLYGAWPVLLFVLLYGGVVSTWTMSADRYLLPLLPLLMVLASLGAEAILERVRPTWKTGARSLAFVVLGAPFAFVVVDDMQTRSLPDTRNEAKAWIEGIVPVGSFVVADPYGPPLWGVSRFLAWNSDLRNKNQERLRGAPIYSLLELPMFQVGAERSAPFYDFSLYEDADFFVVSSEVRSRYEREPARFAPQLRFYEALEERCEQVAEFESSGAGPSLSVWLDARRRPPLPRRSASGPGALRVPEAGATSIEPSFYFDWGANYENFGHVEAAIDAYRIGLSFRRFQPRVFASLALGVERCLRRLDRGEDARRFLAEIVGRAPTEEDRTLLRAAIAGR